MNLSNMQVAIICLLITFAINASYIAIFCIKNKKCKKDKRFWYCFEMYLIFLNTFIFFVTFSILFFSEAKVIQRSVILEPEVISEVVIVKKENLIYVPSIIIPLTPEGKQAIAIDTTSIDTTSIKMKSFMDEFYGENVNFFTNRQNATFLIEKSGIKNYTGLDLTDIQYNVSDSKIELYLDDLGFETIWLISDLSNITIMPTKCKVILYVPRKISNEEEQEIKTSGEITILTIDQIS